MPRVLRLTSEIEKKVPMQKNTVDTKAARELLSRHHILKHLFPSLIERLLEECEICSFEENQSIFIKGDEGDALYGILSGKIRISVISLEGKEIILNIMGQGELFGEIALLDEGPRTADATAQTDCQLIRLRRTFRSCDRCDPTALRTIAMDQRRC